MLAEEWRNLPNEAKAAFVQQYQQNIEKARDEPECVVEGGKRKLWIQIRTQNGQFISVPAFCDI
jgi:hypothetical protein